MVTHQMVSMAQLDSWSKIMFSVLICNNKKEDNLKLVPNLSYSNNIVKIRVVLEVFMHAESKSNLNFVLSLSPKEALVSLCWNP